MTRTEHEKDIYNAYFKSTATSLNDVYGRFSDKKRDAWNRCIALADEYAETCAFVGDVRVLSHNGWIFTAGFVAVNADGTPFFVHITPTKTTTFEC